MKIRVILRTIIGETEIVTRFNPLHYQNPMGHMRYKLGGKYDVFLMMAYYYNGKRIELSDSIYYDYKVAKAITKTMNRIEIYHINTCKNVSEETEKKRYL